MVTKVNTTIHIVTSHHSSLTKSALEYSTHYPGKRREERRVFLRIGNGEGIRSNRTKIYNAYTLLGVEITTIIMVSDK